MKSSITDVLILCMALLPFRVSATSCANPPPCGRLRPDKLFLIGLVAGDGKPAEIDLFGGKNYLYQIEVKEALYGVRPGTTAINVTMGAGFKAGDEILIEGWRDASGAVKSGVCSMTGPSTYKLFLPLIEFLRGLKNRTPEAALTVSVQDGSVFFSDAPIDGADIYLDGPARRHGTTVEGKATFGDLSPGRYSVKVAKPGYRDSAKRSSEIDLNIAPYSCPSDLLWLDPWLEIGGIVSDTSGKPAPNVRLQLWEDAPPGRSRVFTARSDASGAFRFRQVKPGSFHLRTAGATPISYYPGGESKAAAAPVIVRADTPLENLQFVLGDPGQPRTIRVHVVDRDKKLVTGASIINFFINDGNINFLINGRSEQADTLSSFDGMPTTDAYGVATLKGYERSRYRISAYKASKTPGDLVASLPVDIHPGKGDIDVVLVMLSPFKR